jgi:spermidine synthase
MLDPKTWFTESTPTQGAAFSLKIRERLWEEKTPYQTIEVFATEGFGNLMTIDGLVMLTARDNFLYHEMLAHPVLFTHAAPRRVCIIGGGDCGTLSEVLKHPDVESVVQIDIDEGVTRAALAHFPELTARNQDPRATLLFQDGIQWMKDASPGSLDVIIVDSTDPIGPAEGLFGEAFYRGCLAALAEGGILVQQSESPLYNLDLLAAMHGAMRAAGFDATRMLTFPQPVYPSGWWSATLAGKANPLDGFRRADADTRVFETRYYNAEIHQAALALPEFVRQALA